MKKEDVEKIIDLSYKLGRDKYKDGVSLVDMYDLACKISKELAMEPNGKNQTYIFLNKNELERLEAIRRLFITIDDEQEVLLEYVPYAYQLESGAIVSFSEKDENALRFFFNRTEGLWGDNPSSDYDDIERTLAPEDILDNEEPDVNIIHWLVDHIKSIQRVVGFDLVNVEVNKIIDECRVDLCAEDKYGNHVIIIGDRRNSTDETLSWLLSKAISIDARKVIWIAGYVKDEHALIVKWLNEVHVDRINFYLIETKCYRDEKKHKLMTSFKLIESPASGWRDWV